MADKTWKESKLPPIPLYRRSFRIGKVGRLRSQPVSSGWSQLSSKASMCTVYTNKVMQSSRLIPNGTKFIWSMFRRWSPNDPEVVLIQPAKQSSRNKNKYQEIAWLLVKDVLCKCTLNPTLNFLVHNEQILKRPNSGNKVRLNLDY